MCVLSPAHWRVWTRPGCRPVSRCLCSAVPVLWVCSRSAGSGRPCLLRTPAGRADGATKRWPSPPLNARCIAARAPGSSCSTPAAIQGPKTPLHQVQHDVISMTILITLNHTAPSPCCHCLLRRDAGGQGTTWGHRLPVCDPAASSQRQATRGRPSAGSPCPCCPRTAAHRSTLKLLRYNTAHQLMHYKLINLHKCVLKLRHNSSNRRKALIQTDTSRVTFQAG